ncbi:hypothetical protein AURDEDRAFT_185829 [Auricularia subglabra TFB-10046 SS5]|nr:hypothetical protein AURDEDRAFT_185829 [Auricularia subglabra TFB-10046 SS5]
MAATRPLRDLPDELHVRIAEFSAHDGGRRMLVTPALVSRAFNRAATQVLYRTVCLSGQRQARVFLGMLEACETNGTYSPPLLRLVTNSSSHTSIADPDTLLSTAAIAARILDACPNARNVRTSAEILFRLCRSGRAYESVFLGMHTLDDWYNFADAKGFSRLKRIHLDPTACRDDLYRFHASLFGKNAFPCLTHFSIQGYVGYNAPFFEELYEDILVLPTLQRFVLWIPCYVDECPELYGPLVQDMCRLKDERLYIAEGMDDQREFPMWKAYVEGRVDPWDFGRPVAQLL